MKLPAGFPAARNSKSMVHAGTGRWRQKNGRPILIVGSRPAVYRMAVVKRSGLTSFLYQGVCHWNNLPLEIKQCPSKYSFRYQVKCIIVVYLRTSFPIH